MTDHDPHKRRFLLFAATRLAGLAIIGLGFGVAYSDLVRDGGFRKLGGLLIALGTLELVILPHLLKRRWDRQ